MTDYRKSVPQEARGVESAGCPGRVVTDDPLEAARGASSHTHSHAGHSHGLTGAGSGDGQASRRLGTVLILTLSYMAVEAAAGWLTGSLALISDAGHMLTDSAAIALALFAVWFSRKVHPSAYTFGYLRSEILAALINGLGMMVVVGAIIVEAARRLAAPPELPGLPMILVSGAGLLVNLVALKILSGGEQHNLNERGARLHILGDLFGSVGAVTAGLLIQFTGWLAADPLASALIALLILRSTYQLLRETVTVLMEGTPAHLDVAQVRSAMEAIEGVSEVRDLHLWTLAAGYDALSAHVVVPVVESSDSVRRNLRELLAGRFGIAHTTLEIERPNDQCCAGPDPLTGCRMVRAARSRQPSSRHLHGSD